MFMLDLPEILVNDSGRAFASAELEPFCKCNGISHVIISIVLKSGTLISFLKSM